MTQFGTILLLLCPIAQAEVDDWPHWRGPQRSDISTQPSGWDGKSWIRGRLWQFSAGEGSSSPIVARGRVYLTGWANNRDTLYCLDINTGKELWRESYSSPKFGRFAIGDQRQYSGACSTPEFDADSQLLFTLGVDGQLNAWDTKSTDKRRIWSLNLYDRYKAARRPEVAVRRKTRRDYGYMSSALVAGDQLIVEVGAKTGNLVAFDKRSGKELWKSQNRDEAGHTGGPVPMMIQNVPCVAVLTLRNLVVTRIDKPNAGKTVGEFKWTTDFANNIASPAVYGDSVVITSAYNHYAMCRLKVTLKGINKLWENKLASGVCSPVIHDGKIYWAWRGVHCVDFETGKKLWTGGNVGAQGSCILTKDDRLIVYANRGELSLVETAVRSAASYKQLATHKVLSRTDAWPHVVLAQGRLICRDRAGSVQCVSISPKHAPPAKTTNSNPKPPAVSPVALNGPWPGTRKALALAWDRSFKDGRLETGFEKTLTFAARERASFSKSGALKFEAGAFVLRGSEQPLLSSIRKSNQLSIELVLTSKKQNQSGPARIVSFSSDGYSRNFTIGQERDRLILRLRTTQTGLNGMKPEIKLGNIPVQKKTHVVISYLPGQLNCWINGKSAVSTTEVGGDFSNWDAKHHFLLGDEWDGGTVRKWRGEIDRFAIYARAMTNAEVAQRFKLANTSP